MEEKQSQRRPEKSISNAVSCQIGECDFDMILASEYHRRYRCCPIHAAFPSLTINGQEMRFCQKCGRFQPLAEFSNANKTCTHALQKHNSRRKQARNIRRSRSLSTSECPPAGPNNTRGGPDTRTSSGSFTSSDQKSPHHDITFMPLQPSLSFVPQGGCWPWPWPAPAPGPAVVPIATTPSPSVSSGAVPSHLQAQKVTASLPPPPSLSSAAAFHLPRLSEDALFDTTPLLDFSNNGQQLQLHQQTYYDHYLHNSNRNDLHSNRIFKTVDERSFSLPVSAASHEPLPLHSTAPFGTAVSNTNFNAQQPWQQQQNSAHTYAMTLFGLPPSELPADIHNALESLVEADGYFDVQPEKRHL